MIEIQNSVGVTRRRVKKTRGYRLPIYAIVVHSAVRKLRGFFGIFANISVKISVEQDGEKLQY